MTAQHTVDTYQKKKGRCVRGLYKTDVKCGQNYNDKNVTPRQIFPSGHCTQIKMNTRHT